MIKARDKEHLQELIGYEIDKNSGQCSLSHIDVSAVADMSYLFYKNLFNGDISGGNISGVYDMERMFSYSKFNGNISAWDVSQVWAMSRVFQGSNFRSDLTCWRPLSVIYMTGAYLNCSAPIPYWASIADKGLRVEAIESYQRKKFLTENLSPRERLFLGKKLKI